MKLFYKKRDLITISQENLIQCDSPDCDYVIKNSTGSIYEDFSIYIDKPCPKCGENLLTLDDYKSAIALIMTIRWLNKWFSWLTIFINPEKEVVHTAHCHNGINIKEREGDK